jgi:glycosyltransferase domain-containing protein
MEPCADLTILLPLKDWDVFTRRWLAYAAAVDLKCRILIADGSANPLDPALIAHCRERGLDVDYVRYPVDVDYHTYYAKLADAAARVGTPFVVMIDNDDFVIPEGLTRAVQFLRDHPSYVACGGQCAAFWIGGVDADVKLHGDAVEWKYSSRSWDDGGTTAEQRLRERSLGANDVFYSVHRAPLLHSYLSAVRDCNPRDLFLLAELVRVLTAIAGKTRQLETLCLARQQQAPQSSGGTHERMFGNWYDRLLVPTWSDDFSRFVDAAASALAAADDLPIERARRVVVETYKMALAPVLLADLLKEPTVSFSMPFTLQLIRHIVDLPRTSLTRRAAQQLYRRARWLSHDLVYGIEYLSRRANDATREFTPVREFLTAPEGDQSRRFGT